MNKVKRIYLTINLAAVWIAAVLVCDAVGLRELSPVYGGIIMFALAISTVTAFELAVRNNK